MSLLDNFSNDELQKELAERGIPDAAVFMADRDQAIAERDAAVAQRDQLRIDLVTCATDAAVALKPLQDDRDKAYAERDAARAAFDGVRKQLDQLRLSTGLLAVIKPCEPADHVWKSCARSPVTVCIVCGDRVAGRIGR